MKLNFKPKQKPPEPERRQVELPTARRFSFFYPDDEKALAQKLVERAQALKIKFSVAYVLRQGAKQFIIQQNKLFDKAEAGELHAKKRKEIK